MHGSGPPWMVGDDIGQEFGVNPLMRWPAQSNFICRSDAKL